MKQLKKEFPYYTWVYLIWICYACQAPTPEVASPSDNIRLTLADQMEQALRKHSLDPWYPLTIDTVNGGFWSDFNYRWAKEGPQNKMMVTQARHVWTASKASDRYPEEAQYPAVAAHGFKFLQEKMWDPEHGGFYNLVDSLGTVKTNPQGAIIKLAYDNSFGIYALAAYYKMSADEAVLQMAQKAFNWLDEHSHDPVHGGYYQFMRRDGTPFPQGYNGTPPKDQNSSIHLLEAFTELYAVWPDEKVKQRLQELYTLINDTITGNKNYMYLFFNADWSPVIFRDSLEEVREANYPIDHVSFGHDIETAFLLWEAAEALHLEEAGVKPKLKAMVDHAINQGWDKEYGGLFDRGYYFAGEDHLTIIDIRKAWWAQAEALNTLLIWSQWYPKDSLQYFDKFQQQWDYIQTYLLDPEHNGWYVSGIDQEPEDKDRPKAGIWKGNYHDYRSLANCIDRLRQE